MNANASLGREIDNKAALITDLEGKLGIATTTVNQLNDKIANFDKALTNEERASITDAKNAAELAKLNIENTLKLTAAERDMAMKAQDELRAKYDVCESTRRNMPAMPMNAGPMMKMEGGISPSYVYKPMSAMDTSIPVGSLNKPIYQSEQPISVGVSKDVPAELLPISPQQPATAGIADNSLTAKVGFTDIPKQAIQQQIQNARSNPYWTYRPENYDSHDRYAAPSPWWVTGFNS
jgi:hypothetical protein